LKSKFLRMFTVSVLLAGTTAFTCGCDNQSTNVSPGNAALIGKWVDVTNPPGTATQHCCSIELDNDGRCISDTLVLGRNRAMVFTSLIDEPSVYWVARDTLFRFHGSNMDDTLKYAFELGGDTLTLARSPLCDSAGFSPRYRRVRL
jgi:hypothetical protein